MRCEGLLRYLPSTHAAWSTGAVVVALGCGAKNIEFFGPGSGGGASGAAGSFVDRGVDACAATNADALEFLRVQCAQCHSGPQSQVFDFVLDVDSLKTGTSSYLLDPTTMMPARYLVPGDPQHSLLYQRIVDRSMPPVPDVSAAATRPPLPTTSDFSLLHFWISSCLGASPVATTGAGGSTGMGGSSTNGGACGATMLDAPAGSRPADVLWPKDDLCQGEQLPMVGTWDGYVENIMFPSGSDAVHMVVRSANASRVCGSVVFGVLTAPPIVDPARGYPPGVFQCSPDGGAQFVARTVDRFDSFAMTMLDGRSSGPRLQFRSTIDELWKPWCDVQTSYPLAGAPGGYSCVPRAGCAAAGDCSAHQICDPTMFNGSPCRCVSNGCTADPSNANSPAGQLTFDLRVVGDNADGSVDTGAMGVRNLHLTRTP